MKTLLITAIYPPEIGGPATYTYELTQRLPPKISTKVITFGKGSQTGVTYVNPGGGVFFRQLKLFFNILKEGKDSDIFYLQEPASIGLVGLIAAKIYNKPTIVKYVGDPSWEKLRNDNKTTMTLSDFLKKSHPTWLSKATKVVLCNSDKVVTPANYLKELIASAYKVKKEKITVIPNSVSKYSKSQSKKKGNVVMVGRLVNWKNIDYVIKAFKKAGTSVSNLKLTVIGDGPEETSLKKLAKNSNVIFKGKLPKEETLKEMSRSEILILFSDYEGFPHVVVEAFSTQTVVVASDIPGTNEVVKNGVTGLLVAPHDTKNLAEAIVKLQKNKNLRTKIAKNALKYWSTNLTWEVNLKKLTDVFDEVIKK